MDDEKARPAVCGRCGAHVLITIADRCADCIAEMGLHHPEEHTVWRAEVKERYTRR